MTVFVSWLLGIPALRSFPPDRTPMLPNASVGIVMASVALWLSRSEEASVRARRTMLVFAGIACMIGVVSLVERLSGFSTWFDRVFFLAELARYPYRPLGLMATNSTICLTLAGMALLLGGVEVRGKRRPSQVLAAVGLAIASLALVGHLYGARDLYAFDTAAEMALITALGFTALHLGILFSRTSSGPMAFVTGEDIGGILARRMLPASILVPLLFGFLWLRGRESLLFSRESGIAILTLFTIAFLMTLVLRSAVEIRSVDTERERLLVLEEQARAQAESAAEDADRARAHADEANRAKMQFLSMMSHELRTPLNAIDGYAQMLEMGIRGPLTPLQAQDIARIRRSERHLLAIVNDLLNFTRLEAGQVEWNLTQVPVAEVIAEAEPILQLEIEAKAIAYTNVGNCDLAVIADREKLRQILVNLLSNACKFSPEQGALAVECHAEGDRVRIVVRDSGRGIAPDRVDEIFEPFVQIDRHLMREARQGVGLGLAISRQLAAGMGGTLTVQSTVGEGSAFSVTLPRATR